MIGNGLGFDWCFGFPSLDLVWFDEFTVILCLAVLIGFFRDCSQF